MAQDHHAAWTDAARLSLEAYDEALLRTVAGKLVKPRGSWPREHLLDRCQEKITDDAVIDRRLKDLGQAERRTLALIAHSRQPRWSVGNLVEMLMTLGHGDGLEPIKALLEAGLMYPVTPAGEFPAIVDFAIWLGASGGAVPTVFAHPRVSQRALGEDLGLPTLKVTTAVQGEREADGLDWPLRLAALWQLVQGAPLRRTQQGEFFKRDLDRLQQEPLLNTPPADCATPVPDQGILLVAFAIEVGVLRDREGELTAAELPPSWDTGLLETLEELFSTLPRLVGWTPLGRQGAAPGNPYPSLVLLGLLLLANQPEGSWVDPKAIEEWLTRHHPYWMAAIAKIDKRSAASETGLAAFLLGLAYPLRIVRVARDTSGEPLVQLSNIGRWLLGFAKRPQPGVAFPQTLMVQPNLELIAYRQGLTPTLIRRLSRFATWANLGSACTLRLEADRAYGGLESGLTLESILRTLEQHGMRPTPPAVVESLKTWANKRDRLVIYPSAALFEFASAEDLSAAIARGLAATRLTDRLAVVASEEGVDFRHFRLTGTRDYSLQPDQCVEVQEDGVTLVVDLSRSDLMLETELQRFAEPLDAAGVNGKRRYRLTPESLLAGKGSGLDLSILRNWFLQRTGASPPAACMLLFSAAENPPARLRSQLILHVDSQELADGLQQWPGTRSFVLERLGPTALAIPAELLEEFENRLRQLGLGMLKE